MSELDEERRAYLVMSLSENQMFITGTDIDEGILEMYEEPRVIRIDGGHAYNMEW
jgi:DNA replication and repair protein RecF